MSNIIYESSRGKQPIRIEDDFLSRRIIFLTEEVNTETCNELIQQLLYLDSVSDEEITLYINSPGGIVQDGLAVYDTMMLMRSPVRTVCIGTCASMGAIIFLAGEKREMMKHGKIMIHDPAFGGNCTIAGKKSHEIRIELEVLDKCRESLAHIIAERTHKNIEEIYKVTVNDAYFTATEAIDFGLATDIITGGN